MAVDPRAHSKARIVPPEPLPVISRRALARVRNWLPPPEECPYCKRRVSLVRNDAIYGKTYGDWPYAYHCRPCDAMVGLHPGTDIPLGTLANRALRTARAKNKQLFYGMMKARGFTRSQAYEWLALQMGIPQEECHFGWFDLKRCEQAGEICKEVEHA